MRPRTRWQIKLYLGVVAMGVFVGATYAQVNGGKAPLWVLALIGAIHGGTIGAILGAMEIFGSRTRLGQAIERASFPVTILTKGLVYGVVIVVVEVGKIGERVFGLYRPASVMTVDTVRTLVFSIAMTIAFIFVIQIGLVVGLRKLRDLVMGRYHSPRLEERFFLFVDVRGSTGIAERLGPVAVHRFLERVFELAADPVTAHRGEVHQYVGDEMVITWPLVSGRVAARPLACFFAIERALEEAAPRFARDFGVVPHVRAALHAGDVIAGEVGVNKREIVFHGDVMNTASRLEHIAGELDRRLLASADAVNRIEGMEDYTLDDVGLSSLRGRQQGVQVYAVEPGEVRAAVLR
jgi:adenylate cyclase